jgi:hypothetical protein
MKFSSHYAVIFTPQKCVLSIFEHIFDSQDLIYGSEHPLPFPRSTLSDFFDAVPSERLVLCNGGNNYLNRYEHVL